MPSIGDLMRPEAPLRYGASAVFPKKMLWEKQYRFTSRFDEEVLLHRVEGKNMLLPRALCTPGQGTLDTRSKGVGVSFPKAPTPRPNQVEIFAETFAFLDKGLSGLVVCYTGWGKTVLGYAAAAHLGRCTLVVTTKDDIFSQWVEDAPKFLGIKPSEIGIIRGDVVKVHGCKIVVAMIHTLAKDDGRVTKQMARSFGLVIFDECHRVPAESFSVVADMFPAYWRLGLSATPERSDGKELLVYAHIGPVRAATEAEEMIPKVLRYKSVWKCPRQLASFTDPETGAVLKKVQRVPHTPGKTTHIEKILQHDPTRNAQLGDIIKTVFDAGRKTVVFSTLLEHLELIHQAAIAVGVPESAFGLYVGVTGKGAHEEREKAKVKPVMLTTFGMCSEGTNIPWLDCGILAMPRSNVKQPCGRIRRAYDNKRTPVWIDLVDHDSPVFSGYAASRKNWYKSIGAEIHDMD
jgi:superfamily II DNA or RNA helicase